MATIIYRTGDATAPEGSGRKVIVHVCNDVGGWGKGFVVALSRRWAGPEKSYRRWHREGGDPPFELGQVQFVQVETALWVANLIGQKGIRRSGRQPPIRYEAIKCGLVRVAEFVADMSGTVHMPRIGCGLAGGSWDEIAPIIHETLVAAGIPVTVYDFAGSMTTARQLRVERDDLSG